MKKAALFLWLLTTFVYACDATFQSCYKKTVALKVVRGNALYIPLQNDKILVHSDTPVKNALKSDAFLHLYLKRASKKIRHPFKLNRYLPNKELASIHKEIVCGTIVQKQEGLEHLARFSKRIFAPSVILNGCCELVAIGTSRGIVQKPYIEHFLQNGGVYGDLGVRIKQCKEGLVVTSIDPFVKTPFRVGDHLAALNGKKMHDKAQLEQEILFAPVGSVCRVDVFRCDKRTTLKAKVYNRKGGGYLSDTFLERLGVYVDEKLRVKRSAFEKIHKNDKIKVIDGHRVSTQKDVRHWLSKVKSEHFLIGLERKGLDIFIPLSKLSKN